MRNVCCLECSFTQGSNSFVEIWQAPSHVSSLAWQEAESAKVRVEELAAEGSRLSALEEELLDSQRERDALANAVAQGAADPDGTCTDGKKTNDEQGIDCGGGCVKNCTESCAMSGPM